MKTVRPGWTAGVVAFPTTAGTQHVAAWVWGCVALDFRGYWPDDGEGPTGGFGWCLSHVPTGHACWGLLLGLEEAMLVAEEFASIPGMANAVPRGGAGIDARFLAPPVRALKARIGLRVVPPTDLIPPWISAPEIVPRIAEAPA